MIFQRMGNMVFRAVKVSSCCKKLAKNNEIVGKELINVREMQI